ncbi:WD repeat domain phosphoinositide-interacting protein 2 [Echinops telfairi]|uniref:WD repeat domain phosphoinositide-interacting protein 2 n=1 Tax=Echinops telfairi TaxID=9371 RepID=A0AC55CK68_ECHTE|nr:WD repeat domain phosphoinositide-interacting protein 2 [Echinops telfairi]
MDTSRLQPMVLGLCALSISNDNCYLAYPGSATIGEVQVFDTVNLRAANMIPAHDSPLAALAFDASGTKLATASEKGTVIRVFSIPEGQKLFEFRRGVKRCVSICSLAFSMDSLFLSASSNTETVHIFKLETVKENGSMETASEILDSASPECPLVTPPYSAAPAKGAYGPPSPTRPGKECDTHLEAYTDDLGAAGGTCLEEEAGALRLDEDSEHPPMILRTD